MSLRHTLIVVAAAVVVVGAGVVLFAFGQDLFGSDDGTIDSYNRESPSTCDRPPDATLVCIYVLPLEDLGGNRARSMSFVYASPLAADELAGFYGQNRSEIEDFMRSSQACRYDRRPLVLVRSSADAGDGSATPVNAFWGGDAAQVTAAKEIPPGTRSLVRLRVAQRQESGLFGFAADESSVAVSGSRDDC